MAQAGFYYYPRDEQDDTAICFQCGLALDGWEPDDSPRWIIVFNHFFLTPSLLGMSMKSVGPGVHSYSRDKSIDRLVLNS